MFRIFISVVLFSFLLFMGISWYLHLDDLTYNLWALSIGNGLLAAIAIFSFQIMTAALKSKNAHALIQAKYTAMLVKFLVCIGGLVVYILMNGRKAHQPSVFLFLAMYIVYAIVETLFLSKLAKKNA